MRKRKTQIENKQEVARAAVTDESAKSPEQDAATPAPKRPHEMVETAGVANAAERLADVEDPIGTPNRARLMRSAQSALGNARVAQIGGQPVVQRQPRSGRAAPPQVGTRFTHPVGSRSPHRRMTAEFDGREFVLKGDGTELMRVAAASGRPVSVRSRDASRCSGSTTDSYVNNPRYVGIADYGPIPEGEYDFQAGEIATFSAWEQTQFTLGGQFTDPFGRAMHGGDWGAGRSPLHKIRVLPAPAGCGNTGRRSGFYIHGGSLAGSSGCIDIGNAGIAALLPHLTGFRGRITVSVRYRHPAPSVGTLGRAMGGFTYPGQENPSILDRLGGAAREIFGGDEDQ